MWQLSGSGRKGRVARAAGGFTLIELMCVLLILVALAGIVVPKMSNYIQKAHSGAAASNISTLMSVVEAYRANHLFQGYPDYFDSLDDPTSGNIWAGVPQAAAVCLTPLQLDAQAANAMNSAGLNNVMNSNTLVISPSGGGNNATFDLPTSSVPLATGTYVMQISNAAGSAGLAALQLNVPNFDPVNYNYVLLGLGDSCKIVGSDIDQAPVHFDTIDPSVYYQHYGVVFAVPVTGGKYDSLKTGTQATMATVVGIHDGGLSGLRDHLTEYNMTNQWSADNTAGLGELAMKDVAKGFTLLELVLVVAILVALAGMVLPRYQNTAANSYTEATQISLQNVREAIVGSAAGPGFYGDMGQLPVTLKDLFVAPSWAPPAMQQFNPQTGRGWRGPYVTLSLTVSYAVDASGKSGFTSAYGQNGDPAPADAWLRPLVLQIPTSATTPADQKNYARLVSAGPDGIIQTPDNVNYPDPTVRGDDMVLFLYRPDAAP